MSRAWDLMYAGNHDQAIRLMRDEYARSPTLAKTLGLGIAYLWRGDYAAAWEHFNVVNQKRPGYCDSYYEMAGAAKWCLGEQQKAVEQWIEGCDCNYADAAGGVGAPLLLFTASVLEPAIIARSEAETYLLVRTDDERVRNWPGAVAEYLLGRINEATLRQKCVGVTAAGTVVNNWLADFYVGLLRYAVGDLANLAELMHKTAATSPKDFTVGREGLSLKKLYAEFFIARHELAKTSP